jgi:hypothetical protein
MRKGFSMITAIIFMILVATIGALSLSLSSVSVKQTSDLYLREEAEILVQSSTEYALLAISGHNFSANCLNTINATYTPDGTTTVFDINITMYYFGNGLPNNCQKPSGSINAISSNIDTNESNLTVLIDTIVTSTATASTEPIRIHRRTLQKP